MLDLWQGCGMIQTREDNAMSSHLSHDNEAFIVEAMARGAYRDQVIDAEDLIARGDR
jgi:hypothetical protein